MCYVCFQSLKESDCLELTEGALKVRGKIDPTKWPMEAQPLGLSVSSTLHADVPEFVPGQMYPGIPPSHHEDGIHGIYRDFICLKLITNIQSNLSISVTQGNQ